MTNADLAAIVMALLCVGILVVATLIGVLL